MREKSRQHLLFLVTRNSFVLSSVSERYLPLSYVPLSGTKREKEANIQAQMMSLW